MPNARPRTHWFVLVCTAGLILGVMTTICATVYYVGFYRPRAMSQADDKQREPAQSALREATDPYQRWLKLSDAAMASVEKDALDEAEQYAKELLLRAESHRNDWNYGNAIHKGHIVLGRVALRRDDIQAAKKHLVAAGKTPGSPQLNSFGPNMTLAKELLERGETQAPIAYFNLCAAFWQMDQGQLQQWKKLAEQGLVPDFGANLRY